MNQRVEEYPVGTIFDEKEITAIKQVLESGETLTRGPEVELFEKEFASYCNAKHAISTSSCGGALNIASKVLNLKKNDEVICQANVFWVTIVNLLERNVTIKCADIEKNTLNIDPNKIEPLITDKTKAIYVLHHGGNPVNLDPIREIAESNNLAIVEDAAHAVGAEYKGNKIGHKSDIACFSFSSLKNMSTLGEGGMFVTNDEDFAEKAWGLRTNYPYGNRQKRHATNIGSYHKPKSPAFMHAGDAWDYEWLRVDEIGSTYRMSSAQAAVGRVQLKKLDKHNNIRKGIADTFNKTISEIDEFSMLNVLPKCKHAWHLFTFFLKDNMNLNRDYIIKRLDTDYNIHSPIRFWPIHLGGIMRMNGHDIGECPACEDVWFNQQLSLPISPQMKDWEIQRINTSLKEIIKLSKPKLIN